MALIRRNRLRVIKDNSIHEDGWNRIAGIKPGERLPEGDIILPFQYWKGNRDSLKDHKGRIAVCINGDDRIEDVAASLQEFELIALEFPAFKDGRCYSHARLLRDRYHYQGDIRAVGDVLRDQLFYMKRCGISSFAIREDKDIQDALNALRDFTVTYQTAADGNPPIYKVRN
jgi:uncharacterized protein (DUF934 family)